MDFGDFSIDDIADKTLRALGFHIFATEYLEEVSPCFTDMTDLELSAKPAVVDNLGQVVTNSEEKVVKKKNKCAAKKKERLAKLHALFGSFLSLCLEFSLFSSPRSVPALVPALVPAPVPALVTAPLPAPVLALVLAPFYRFGSYIVLSSGHMLAAAAVSCRGIPALMLPLLVFSLSLLLGLSSFRPFK